MLASFFVSSQSSVKLGFSLLFTRETLFEIVLLSPTEETALLMMGVVTIVVSGKTRAMSVGVTVSSTRLSDTVAVVCSRGTSVLTAIARSSAWKIVTVLSAGAGQTVRTRCIIVWITAVGASQATVLVVTFGDGLTLASNVFFPDRMSLS